MSDPIYDRIGIGYAGRRQADPRIASIITNALGHARTVLNVGAGSGSYEPIDRRVVAVDPSVTMLGQRRPGIAPAARAVAEALPFPSRSFDAAMAVLSVHHWLDQSAGVRELRRVSDRQIILTWDPEVTGDYWLVTDYLPEVASHEAGLDPLDCLLAELDVRSVTAVPVPADCTDGFLAAYWRRPEAYLDDGVRAAISGISLLDQDVVSRAMKRLAADLADGTWARRHRNLFDHPHLDVGYRLVVAGAL